MPPRIGAHEAPRAVVIIDLDHFKRINDTWGHPTGDRVPVERCRTRLADDALYRARHGGRSRVETVAEMPAAA